MEVGMTTGKFTKAEERALRRKGLKSISLQGHFGTFSPVDRTAGGMEGRTDWSTQRDKFFQRQRLGITKRSRKAKHHA
jgi:hypothetical protein